MNIIPILISGLPVLGKIIDRFFPDKKDERAELRRALYGSKAFQWFLWFFLFLAVYEVALKTIAWVFPQFGWPDSIILQLEYVKILVNLILQSV